MTTTPKPVIVLTRQQLYERVWDTPMRMLGPELGVTDVGLKKICSRFNIPTPGLGYWAKLLHGRSPQQPKLPKIDDPGFDKIKFSPGAPFRSPRLAAPEDPIAEREHEPASKINVADQLEDPLPVVARTLRSLVAAKPDAEGRVQPRAQKTLDVRVAPERVERACRIMQALMTALDDRELVVSVSGNSGGTSIEVLNEQVSFGLYELVRQQERPPTPEEKREAERWSWHAGKRYLEPIPTGDLCLTIFSGPANGRRRRFTDSRRRPVENLLNAFVIALYRVAEDIKTDRAHKEQLRLQREEAERNRREFERQRVLRLQEIADEEKRIAGLMAEVRGWDDARRVRRYVDAVRAHVQKRDGCIELGGEADEWIRWASDQADRLDPLTHNPPSIFDEQATWERPRYW